MKPLGWRACTLNISAHGTALPRTLSGRVRAVRGAKRVVDVDVGILGQLLGEARVVLLLLLVEAHILQHEQLRAIPVLF